MDEITTKNSLLDYISEKEGPNFSYDSAAILQAHKLRTENSSSITIKILTIFGGFLASLAFLGFLLLAGLYDSEIGLLSFGLIFIGAAIWLNKAFDKLIIDTFSISMYAIGFALFIFSLNQLIENETLVLLLICAVACSSLVLCQRYIISFISVLIFNASLLNILFVNDLHNLIQVYIIFEALLVTYIFLNEAKLICLHKKLCKLYYPLRIGFIISLLFGLVSIGKKNLIPITQNYSWLSSIIFIAIIMYIAFRVLTILEITTLKHKITIYILSFSLLLLTIFSPSISGALIILLLSFMVNYKTGLAIGILSFIYFTSQFYYDLNFTLLTKSIILFSTGIVFLFFFLFTSKYVSAHEKI